MSKGGQAPTASYYRGLTPVSASIFFPPLMSLRFIQLAFKSILVCDWFTKLSTARWKILLKISQDEFRARIILHKFACKSRFFCPSRLAIMALVLCLEHGGCFSNIQPGTQHLTGVWFSGKFRFANFLFWQHSSSIPGHNIHFFNTT